MSSTQDVTKLQAESVEALSTHVWILDIVEVVGDTDREGAVSI